MSNKKNLPNIPIYIGDWERDCNVLSLESEAAWMRIVFKLWTKGKQNTIKIPTKSLQNLWRCSPEKMREILDDLIFNDIAEITENTGFIQFTCRRFVKENELSEIRSKAAKSSKTNNKTKAKLKQNLNKNEQNTDYANENDNEDDNIDFRKSENFLDTNDEFLNEVCDYFSQTREALKMRVHSFMSALIKQNKFSDFKEQTKAYIQYKKTSGEQSHRWTSYVTEWQENDWINALKNLNNLKVKTEKKAILNR